MFIEEFIASRQQRFLRTVPHPTKKHKSCVEEMAGENLVGTVFIGSPEFCNQYIRNRRTAERGTNPEVING